jgi:tetratricopeptide (TPR) repeat protein
MPPYQQEAPEDVLKAVMAGNFVPPRQRNPDVPPPLEAICLKAMARHPDDRYRSARALAEDVERWMADEPVHAWPEPVAARCWRWASRHRTSIVAAAAVLLAVIGVVFGVQNNMLQSANVLLADKNDQLDAARGEAVTRSQRAAETLTDLNDELDSLQPDESAFRVVLPNIVQLADELSDDAGKQVQLAKAFGGAFERLGLYSEQTAAWQTVYDLSLAEYGKTHEDTIAALGNLAGATLQAGRQDEALPLLQEAVTLCRQKFGAEHGNTLNAVNNLAVALQDAGNVTAAIPHFKEVLRIRLAVDGEESPDTLTAMSNFATALKAIGQFNEAAEEFARARALQREHLPGDMQLGLGLTNNLGMAWLDAGDVDRARALFDEAAVAFEEEYSEGHPLALIFRNNVALADHVAGHYEKSIPLFRAVLDGKRNVLPEDHPSIVTSESNLANALDDVGQFQEAEQLHLKIVQFRRGSGENPNPPDVALATALAMLARNQLLQGNYAFAETVCREALPIMESESPEHWRHFDTQSLLGGALLGQERYDAAEPLLLSGFEGMQQRSKTIPSATKSRQPEAAQRLVDLYVAMGNTAATEKWNAELDRLTQQPRTTPSGTN